MEIGDVYVVNKADKVEAEMLFNVLRFAIDTAEVDYRDGWKPKLVKTIATKGVGIKETVDIFEEHLEYLKQKGIFDERIRERRIKMMELLLRKKVNDVITKIIRENNEIISKKLNEEHDIIGILMKCIN
jgi:Putative periplasmic protein kinase ArgK and related GTPases of G3E family